MSKVVKAIIGVALVVVGVVTGNFQLVLMGASMFVQALIKPKGRPRAASAATLQVGEVARQALYGRAATAGSLVDCFNYGGKYGTDWEVLVIALADHKCDALEGFYVNDAYVGFGADGMVAGYNNQLAVYWRPGTEAQSVPSILTTNGPGWTANDNGAGVCYVVVAYKADEADAKNPIWPGGRPKFLWVLRGALCYDSRKDGTVGGSGAHRRDVPATWQWTENPIVCRYSFARGMYACDRVGQPDQLLVGRGLSALEAPPENVFARANLCDEVVDGEARYRVSGVVDATETFIDVEGDFAAACAGTIVQPQGCVEIDPGQARAAVMTITDRDLLVGGKVTRSWFRSISDKEWVNTVVATYVEPSQKWTSHAAPVHRDNADIAADKSPRELLLQLGFVIYVKQAGRIAEIMRRFGRLPITATIPLPPRFAQIEEGDWIIWQSDRYLKGGAYTFRVDAWGSDQGWRHTLTLRQISASVFSDTAPLTDGSVAVQQAAPPPIGQPGPGAWAATYQQNNAQGDFAPAIVVTGAVDDVYASQVRFEYWRSDGVTAPAAVTNWTSAGIAERDTVKREITGIGASSTYYVAISYLLGGQRGDRRILGPVAVGAFPTAASVRDELLLVGADGNLSMVEKQTVKIRYDDENQARQDLDTAAGNFSITTERTGLASAWSNLTVYLATISPAWNNTSTASNITRATWEAKWGDYFDKKAALQKRISEEAAKRAIIGNGVTDINGNPIAVENVANNLALIDWWKEGATIPWGLNSASVANAIYAFPRAGWPAEVTGPMGVQDDCWYCEDSDGDTGGGWNGGQVRPLDPDKTYRFVVPIMHGGNSAGNAYWGCANVCDLNTTTPAANPYLCVLNHTQMVQHRWYLFVGYIHPRNSSGKTHDDAGIWDTVTGQKLTAGFTANNFCFRPDGLQPTYRAYQYYVGGTSYQMFGKPLIECVDGTQSDLRGYFRPGALTYNVAQKLTAIGPATIKIEGTTASKASGSGFDAAVRGERISGPVFASATIRQAVGHTMVSLATGSAQYDRPDAKFYIQYRWDTGAVEIWTGGASPAWTGTITSGLVGEVAVTYDRRGYSATVAGTPVGGFYAAQPDLAHYPVFYIYDGSNAMILGLRYGPATDNLTAAGDIKLTNIGGAPALIFGNTIIATSGGYAETVRGEAIQGPCFAEIDIIADYIYCMVCLDDSPTSTVNTSQRIWVYYNYGLGYLYVSIPGAGGYGNTIGQCAGKLRVAYDGANWRITVGSTEPFTTSAPAGLSLFPKWYTYNTGVSYTGLRAGPFNDARWSVIGPIGKPEDYSTRGNNKNFNGDASAGLNGLYDHATINGGVDLATGSNAIGGDASFRFYKSSVGDYVTRAWRAIAVVPGQKYFVRVKVRGSAATASGLYVRIAQGVAGADPVSLNPHGSSGGIVPLVENAAVSTTVTSYEFSYTVPAGVYWISVGVLNWASGPTNLYVDDVYFGETQLAADVTLQAQIDTSIVADKSVNANYAGALNNAGDLPVLFSPSVLKNSTSIKLADNVTYAIFKPSDGTTGADGGTATVNNTNGSSSKGDVSVSAFSGSSTKVSFILKIYVDGIVKGSYTCTLTKKLGDPPSGGSGGGGNKLAVVQGNQSTTSTSYAAAHSAAAPSLVVASGEKLYVTGILTYSTYSSSTYGTFVNQYSSNGTSWTDFAAGAIAGSTAATGYYTIGGEWIDGVEGSVNLAQSQTVSAGIWFVRTIFKTQISGRDVNLDGSNITYEAKP